MASSKTDKRATVETKEQRDPKEKSDNSAQQRTSNQANAATPGDSSTKSNTTDPPSKQQGHKEPKENKDPKTTNDAQLATAGTNSSAVTESKPRPSHEQAASPHTAANSSIPHSSEKSHVIPANNAANQSAQRGDKAPAVNSAPMSSDDNASEAAMVSTRKTEQQSFPLKGDSIPSLSPQAARTNSSIAGEQPALSEKYIRDKPVSHEQDSATVEADDSSSSSPKEVSTNTSKDTTAVSQTRTHSTTSDKDSMQTYTPPSAVTPAKGGYDNGKSTVDQMRKSEMASSSGTTKGSAPPQQDKGPSLQHSGTQQYSEQLFTKDKRPSQDTAVYTAEPSKAAPVSWSDKESPREEQSEAGHSDGGWTTTVPVDKTAKSSAEPKTRVLPEERSSNAGRSAAEESSQYSMYDESAPAIEVSTTAFSEPRTKQPSEQQMTAENKPKTETKTDKQEASQPAPPPTKMQERSSCEPAQASFQSTDNVPKAKNSHTAKSDENLPQVPSSENTDDRNNSKPAAPRASDTHEQSMPVGSQPIATATTKSANECSASSEGRSDKKGDKETPKASPGLSTTESNKNPMETSAKQQPEPQITGTKAGDKPKTDAKTGKYEAVPAKSQEDPTPARVDDKPTGPPVSDKEEQASSSASQTTTPVAASAKPSETTPKLGEKPKREELGGRRQDAKASTSPKETPSPQQTPNAERATTKEASASNKAIATEVQKPPIKHDTRPNNSEQPLELKGNNQKGSSKQTAANSSRSPQQAKPTHPTPPPPAAQTTSQPSAAETTQPAEKQPPSAINNSSNTTDKPAAPPVETKGTTTKPNAASNRKASDDPPKPSQPTLTSKISLGTAKDAATEQQTTPPTGASPSKLAPGRPNKQGNAPSKPSPPPPRGQQKIAADKGPKQPAAIPAPSQPPAKDDVALKRENARLQEVLQQHEKELSSLRSAVQDKRVTALLSQKSQLEQELAQVRSENATMLYQIENAGNTGSPSTATGKVGSEAKGPHKRLNALRRTNVRLRQKVEIIRRAIIREVGDDIPLSKVLAGDAPDWKARAQQLSQLKARLKMLRADRLATSGDPSTSSVLASTSSFVSISSAERGVDALQKKVIAQVEAGRKLELVKLAEELEAKNEEINLMKVKTEGALVRCRALEAQVKNLKNKMTFMGDKAKNDEAILEIFRRHPDVKGVLQSNRSNAELSDLLRQRVADQERHLDQCEQIIRELYQQMQSVRSNTATPPLDDNMIRSLQLENARLRELVENLKRKLAETEPTH